MQKRAHLLVEGIKSYGKTIMWQADTYFLLEITKIPLDKTKFI